MSEVEAAGGWLLWLLAVAKYNVLLALIFMAFIMPFTFIFASITECVCLHAFLDAAHVRTWVMSQFSPGRIRTAFLPHANV